MRITAEQDRQMNFAMMKAGAAMMAGESEFALTNVGKGLEIGIAAYEKSEDKIAELQDKKMEIEEKADTIDRERKLAALNFGMKQYQADQSNIATYMTNLAKIKADARNDELNRISRETVANIGAAPDAGDYIKAAEYLEDANWSDSYDVAEGATKHQKEGNDSNYNSNKQQARNRELELLLNLPKGSISGAAQYKSSNYQIISGPTGKFPGQT